MRSGRAGRGVAPQAATSARGMAGSGATLRQAAKWSSGRRFPDGARTTSFRLRRLRESIRRRVFSYATCSHHLVEPGDRTAVAGVPVDLEVGVPGRTEEFVHAMPEGFDGAGGRREVPQLLLADHDVAVGAG